MAWNEWCKWVVAQRSTKCTCPVIAKWQEIEISYLSGVNLDLTQYIYSIDYLLFGNMGIAAKLALYVVTLPTGMFLTKS
jgi:hypothetical protein